MPFIPPRQPFRTAGLILGLINIARVPAPGAAALHSHAAPPRSRPTAIRCRLCAGIEEGLLFPLPRDRSPAPESTRLAVALALKPAAPRFQITGLPVRGSDGRETALAHLQVPDGTRPGHFEGTLTIRAGGAITRQPISIEILPFPLMRPSRQYAVTLAPAGEEDWRAPDQADVAAFRRLRALGIGALCLQAAPVDRAALEATMRAAGLRGPVLAPMVSEAPPAAAPAGSTTPPSAAPEVAPSRAEPVGPGIRWYQLCDPGSPAATGAPPAADRVLRAGRVRSLEEAGSVDLPIFAAAGDAGARLLRGAGRPGSGLIGWWSWDAGAATPLENRLRCGALLWKSGLSGSLIEISAPAVADPDWPLRWEGIAQGIEDARYLTTLAALTRQLKDKARSSPLPGQAEKAIAAALDELAEHPSLPAVAQMREVAITWILRLGRVVGF